MKLTLAVLMALSLMLSAWATDEKAQDAKNALDMAPMKPLAQEISYSLGSSPGTACEVRLEPGKDFRCSGKSVDAMRCTGIVVHYNKECVEVRVSKEKP